MADQVEARRHGAYRHPQIVTILLDDLPFDGETGLGQQILEIELDILFLAGGRIDFQHLHEDAAQAGRVDGAPEGVAGFGHLCFSGFSIFFRFFGLLRERLRVM